MTVFGAVSRSWGTRVPGAEPLRQAQGKLRAGCGAPIFAPILVVMRRDNGGFGVQGGEDGGLLRGGFFFVLQHALDELGD